MTEQGTPPGTSRRRFLGGAAAAGVGLAAGAAVATGYGITSANDASAAPRRRRPSTVDAATDGALAVVPFYGPRQAGITTAQQERLMFAALDVTTTDVQELQADARPVGGHRGPAHRREARSATHRSGPSSRRSTPASRWTWARTR